MSARLAFIKKQIAKELEYKDPQLCPRSKTKREHTVKSRVRFVSVERAEHKPGASCEGRNANWLEVKTGTLDIF